MHKLPEFLAGFEKKGVALLQKGLVREPLFSRSTYQFEVRDERKKGAYFPFLQVADDGRLGDAFCTCKDSEAGNGCPHLAAAVLRIFNGKEEPLHIRFERSLWNHLLRMASRQSGYDVDCLKQAGDGYFASDLFSVTALTPEAKKRLDQMIQKRVVETEETSIKFFNRSAEEIAQYKAGNGSESLLYELSFWSDLAKWLMGLDEEGQPYEISFDGAENGIPNAISIKFAGLAIRAHIAEADWPEIIPTLAWVKSPLQVFGESGEGIDRIEYDPKLQTLEIFRKEEVLDSNRAGIAMGDWLFVPGSGFHRQHTSLLFHNRTIPASQISEVFSQSIQILQKYLEVHTDPVPAQYHLHFDDKAGLHIELYLHEVGDLQVETAALFPPYAYLPGKGFYLIKNLMFEELHKVIAKRDVPEFINRHRLWLHNIPGFQTHLGSLEAHLTFHITDDEALQFEAELNFVSPLDEVIDLQEWAYIKGSGFYMKKENRGFLPLHPGLIVKKGEIPSFLASHKEELEQVHGFLAKQPIILRTGLEIGLDEEGLIVISPHIEYQAHIDKSQIQIYGDFVYAPGIGFSEVPLAARLPERYRTQTTIPASQESTFLTYELEPLRIHILSIDPRLQKSNKLQLKIRKIERARRRRSGEWLLDLVYESELGSIDAFAIWDAFAARKKHLFSDAGLLNLKEPRFNWLRQMPKQRLDRKKRMLRLSTLEWIRLCVFEEVHEPKGNDPESVQIRKLLEELQRFETDRSLDTSNLKATLRPYQETGLQWLWFLYCHSLSGLLCDDMGLGKTHQAMALLAAIVHEDKERGNKYLVVCPTSVIYHWQELLHRFLPELRVCTYYGLARSLDQFETHYDLLLTSYGILRTGRDDLRSHTFEVAIFDEIQIAKNSSSQTHRALRTIRAHMRLGLTGTPIENRIREIKSLLDVVLPGYMPQDAVFRDLFVTPIEKYQDEATKQLLSKLIKPFILRRKKSEVLLDLPEKIEEIAYCDLSDEQRALYAETAASLRNTVYAELKNEERPISYVHVFSALSRLKQICNHPALVKGTTEQYRDHQSGKWDLFVELLAEARNSGQKVVVFSQYLGMLAIIEDYLKHKGIGFATIKGSTRDRSEQLLKFRGDPACEVFTASLLAAGVGIDLTVASIVIHYDRWWNPAKENQATDRVHRIGQNRGVQVFKLVTKHTIEEHIHDLIERKKGLMESVVGQSDADQINYLSREELLQVFEKIFEEAEE